MESRRLIPREHQPPLPHDRLLLAEAPSADAVPMDVVFVGGGPAGLTGAIELARLVKDENDTGDGLGEVEIAVLEKAGELGQHSLSGAVLNPRALRELFPELGDDDFPFRRHVVEKEALYLLRERSQLKLPTPRTMRNHSFSAATKANPRSSQMATPMRPKLNRRDRPRSPPSASSRRFFLPPTSL